MRRNDLRYVFPEEPSRFDRRSRTSLGTTAPVQARTFTGCKRPHDASSLAVIRIILRSTGTDEMANGHIGTIASFRGLARHMRWPAHWNERMLNFLSRHPLGIARDQAKRDPGATLSLQRKSE
jgi:hypothetical protein